MTGITPKMKEAIDNFSEQFMQMPHFRKQVFTNKEVLEIIKYVTRMTILGSQQAFDESLEVVFGKAKAQKVEPPVQAHLETPVFKEDVEVEDDGGL